MFLLMSSWSEAISEKILSDKKTAVPRLLGATFASAGIGITVTSLTDFVTFIIGTTSTFRSVTNFSIYTGDHALCETIFPKPLTCSVRLYVCITVNEKLFINMCVFMPPIIKGNNLSPGCRNIDQQRLQ